MNPLPTPKPWLSIGGTLCEGPLWDGQALHWVDIPSGRLFRRPWGSNDAPQCQPCGGAVGGFTFQEDGSYLLFRETDIARLKWGSEPEPILSFQRPGVARFNDLSADPAGRVFAGTYGPEPAAGGLFRLDHDGSITQVASGSGCSNGIAFSPALDALYWVCSTRRQIFRFPYSVKTGVLGEPDIFFQAESADGIPDGLTIDEEGNLYSIRWEAAEHALIVLNPDGKVLHRQSIPAKATTSATFCGPELDHLAVTSAAMESDPGRPADLFLLPGMPIKGRAEFRSSILL